MKEAEGLVSEAADILQELQVHADTEYMYMYHDLLHFHCVKILLQYM